MSGIRFDCLEFSYRNDKGNHGKKYRRTATQKYRKISLVSGVVFGVPTKKQDQRSRKTAPQQPPPRLKRGHRQNGDIQQAYVGEQDDFVIFSGREQRRGGEAADKGETGKDFCVLTPRQRHRCARHNNHRDKCGRRRNQVVDLIGAPQGKVERADADSLQRVRKGLVALFRGNVHSTAPDPFRPVTRSRFFLRVQSSYFQMRISKNKIRR